jgi:LacI family transcriptional regulator
MDASVPSPQNLLAGRDRPTALICSNDVLALDVMGTVVATGLRIPDDVAVTGFSDCLPNVEWYRVPLTTVRTDLEAMGRQAMQTLLREVAQGVSKRHEVTQVSAELIVRASSGTAPRQAV